MEGSCPSTSTGIDQFNQPSMLWRKSSSAESRRKRKALDIKNAFNSASWKIIDSALIRMSCPAYLMAITRWGWNLGHVRLKSGAWLPGWTEDMGRSTPTCAILKVDTVPTGHTSGHLIDGDERSWEVSLAEVESRTGRQSSVVPLDFAFSLWNYYSVLFLEFKEAKVNFNWIDSRCIFTICSSGSLERN